MTEDFYAVGLVAGPLGLRGELKVEVLTDFPQRLKPGALVFLAGAPYRIERSRASGQRVILKLSGIETRDQAEALRGLYLEVPESALTPLPEGQFYQHQIIGLEVRTTGGMALGHVAEILRTGSNDVYVARREGKELLIPAIADVVKEIDVAAGRMTIVAIPGLLE